MANNDIHFGLPGPSNQDRNGGYNGIKAADISHLLRDRIAILTGGRDKSGRPIISFPSRDNAEKTSLDDLRMVLLYLHAIPGDETKDLGFIVLIDMRKGITWNAVKPILKTLQDYFPGNVHAVYIIKPDRFWEKHKANIASAKYKFEVQVIAVDNLTKYIDQTQLTSEFDGNLVYDHDDWLELRVALEDMIWRALDVLRIFATMREELENGQLPIDVDTARIALENNTKLRKRIAKAPVEQLEVESQQLIQRLTGNMLVEEGGSIGGVDSDYGSAGRDSTVNPDFSTAAPNVISLLENLRTTRQEMYNLWQNRKQRLDQCFQLKLFEQDADKMFHWIRQHVELFISNYADIGDSHESAQAVQRDHEEFSRAAMNTYVNIQHITTVAQRLLDTSHYASPRIKAAMSRLDEDWTLFQKALDVRSDVLTLSVNFHYKAQQYMTQAPEWCAQCHGSSDELPRLVPELEAAIHKHQQLMDIITQSYQEIHMTSKKLLYHLDQLVQLCLGSEEVESDVPCSAVHNGKALVQALKNPPPLEVTTLLPPSSDGVSPASTPDYTAGATHVLRVIHGLLDHQRQIEQNWQQRRVRLHQRLALYLFEQDVKQVLDWLANHGELFLRKNMGIGKNLQRARALQKSQQHFENVAKNTYTNAEKLLAAAEELSHTGECRREEVDSVAQQLNIRISAFAKQVQSRRHLLNLSVLFHTHYKEMLAWYDEVEREETEHQPIGNNLVECEQKQDAWLARTDATLQAYATAVGEGQQLASLLRQQQVAEGADNAESLSCVETMLGDIERRQTRLADRWQQQRLALQLGGKFRLFEQDCVAVSGQLDGWHEDMRQMNSNLTPSQAEKVIPLHQENTNHVHGAMLEIMSHAQEQIQVLENSGLQLATDDSQAVLDCILSLAEKLKSKERDVMLLADETSVLLDQALQLGRLQTMANQVVSWITNEERVLTATFSIPRSLNESEQIQNEHKEFQVAVEKTNQIAIALQEKAEQMLASNHYDPIRVRQLAEDVLARWRRLVGLTEERHKLLQSACTYYRTLNTVIPVLDNLQTDYEQNKDWCTLFSIQTTQSNQDNLPNAPDKVTFMSQLLSLHMDKKERFLRGCTYARKNSELFLKYVRRSVMTQTIQGVEANVLDTLEQLRQRENHVLQLWTKKKKQLDQCQQFVLLEASAKNVLDWLHEKAEVYLSTRPTGKEAKEQTEKLLEQHIQFKNNAKEQREKVRIFLGLANNIVVGDENADGHLHTTDIKQWMSAVQQRYNDFSQRMDKVQKRLQADLGRPETHNRDLALDRQSDPNLEAKIKDAAREFDEAKRKSARRKELVMAEILKTEMDYVDDLETCIRCYLEGMKETNQADIPACLRGKESTIFSNIEEIYTFHKEWFLKELKKYESLPEDVGHCFVAWAERFETYVRYCKNKELSNQIIGGPEALKFFGDLQHKHKLNLQLQSYLIKPVQRITKYQLLLKELRLCCDDGSPNEIMEGLEVMLSVPRKANDILHVSMLEGCSDLENLGDVLLQDTFAVWDPKQLIKKGRERQVFLFDLCVLFSKKVPDSHQQSKYRYNYKHRLMLSEINVTEHIEGDECKFALWTGQVPNNEYRTIMKAPSHKEKVLWVKNLRELIGERILHLALPRLRSAHRRHAHNADDRKLNESDTVSRVSHATDTSAEGDALTAGDRNSIHSLASSLSSDVEQLQIAQCEVGIALADHTPSGDNPLPGEIALTKGQRVEVLERSPSYPDWCFVRLLEDKREGLVPVDILSAPEDETGVLADENGPLTSSGVMKRKSFKRFFSKEKPKTIQRQQSADVLTPNCKSENDVQQPSTEDLQRKGGSVYSKLKLRSQNHKQQSATGNLAQLEKAQCSNSDDRAVTPPLASEEDLPDNERVSSDKQTPLTNSPSLVLSETVPAGSTLCSAEIDIEIPPPMDSLASDKLIMNGQTPDDCSTPNSKTSAAATPTAGDNRAPSEMTQEIEEMVRLRLNSEQKQSNIGDEGSSTEQTTPCQEQPSSSSQMEDPTSQTEVQDEPEPEPAESMSPEEVAKMKRKYVLMELVETERDYVRDLGGVVDGYMVSINQMELPEDIQGKDKIVFANIQQIWDFHKTTFLNEIEKCLEDYSFAGKAFVKYERRLHMYVVYCQNKPKSEYLVQQDNMEAFFNDIRIKLGQRLNLGDLLIKPVQRIMKYQLLLKDILKYTERAKEDTDMLKKALQVMHVVPKSCDDMMQVGRLQGFDGKITAQGKLLHQGTLQVSENPPNQAFKPKDRRLFVFEQSIIIADCIMPKKEFANANYIFKSHIMVNKMSMDANVPDEPLRFILKNSDPGAAQSFLMQTASLEEKEIWIKVLKRLLDAQQDFLRALQQPIEYQNKQQLTTVDDLKAGEKEKKGRSPIINRLMGGSSSKNTPQRVESCPNGGSSKSAVVGDGTSPRNTRSKLFGFGRKDKCPKSPTSPPPAKDATVICKFDAVREGDISVKKGDTVDMIVQQGTRCLVRSRSEPKREGWIPNYLLEPAEIYGDTMAEKIEFRRHWYQRLDRRRGHNVLSSNLDTMLENTQYIHKLKSFVSRSPTPNRSFIASRVKGHSQEASGWKPEVVQVLRDQTVSAGNSVEMEFEASAYPRPSFFWYGPAFDNTPVMGKERIKIESIGNGNVSYMTMKDCNVMDSGQYTVTAINKHGKCVSMMWLTVLGPPGAPMDVTAEPHKSNNVRLRWNRPQFTGNSSVLWYTVLFRTEEKSEFETAVECVSDTTVLIEDLSPGKTYWFSVRAFNQAAIGPPSQPSKPTVIGPDMTHSTSIHEIQLQLNTSPSTSWRNDFYKHFYVENAVGSGRFALVKQCFCAITGRPYAIKEFAKKDHWDPKSIEKEFSLLTSLRHPGIVQAFEGFVTEREYILVLQWVPGPPVFDFICHLGYYSELVVREFVKQLLHALSYLHSYEIAHLDIKPENLLIDPSRAPIRLILIDFGDAAIVKEGITTVRQQGTIEYLAPEQINNKVVTTKADIWSVGVITYTFLSGVSAFVDHSLEQTHGNILSVDYSFPKAQFAHVSHAALGFVTDLINISQAKRPSADQCLMSNWQTKMAPESKWSAMNLQQYLEVRQVEITKTDIMVPV